MKVFSPEVSSQSDKYEYFFSNKGSVRHWEHTEGLRHHIWPLSHRLQVGLFFFSISHTVPTHSKMLKNVQFFAHMYSKFAKSALMTQIFCHWKKFNMGIKKGKISCWFQIRWCRLKTCSYKKVVEKTCVTIEYICFYTVFQGLLLKHFCRSIFYRRH